VTRDQASPFPPCSDTCCCTMMQSGSLRVPVFAASVMDRLRAGLTLSGLAESSVKSNVDAFHSCVELVLQPPLRRGPGVPGRGEFRGLRGASARVGALPLGCA
jgi:hypothetical protein